MSEVIEAEATTVVCVIPEFNEFDTKLTEFNEKYVDVVYDMDNKKQNKQARSDQATIGIVCARLKDKKKELKAPLKAEYDKKIELLDSESKRIDDGLRATQSDIKGQIKKHEDGIKLKAAELQTKVSEIVNLGQWDEGVILNSEQLNERLTKLKAIAIDDSFEDRKGDAAIAKDEITQMLDGFISDANAHEVEQKKIESERLAKEKEDHEKMVEQIRVDADVKAKADAQDVIDKAAQDVIDADKRTKDAEAKTLLDASEKERLEKVRADNAEAETARLAKKVIDDAAQAVIDQDAAVKLSEDNAEAERLRKEKADADDKKLREENDELKAEAKKLAVAAWIEFGISEKAASRAYDSAAKGYIPGVSVHI